jgi:beta-glucanase (GH16 family)
MKKHFISLFTSAISLLLLAGCGKDSENEVIPPAPDEAGEKKEWTLVFEDNFDGASVNTAEWTMYNGGGHVGNGLRRPEAFSTENGLLVVTAQMKDGQLVSGGMAHKRSYKYGRFEFRVRTEADPSQATSGVVLTWPTNENWPVDGELDIYETVTAASRNPFHTFIHYGESNNQEHFIHQADGTEWHTMMCEWTPDNIRIFRDGIVVYTLSKAIAIPKVEHHVCIQLDAFKTSMTGTVHMYVDWLKIYQQL